MGRKPLLTKEKVLVALQGWTARNGAQPSVEELRRVLTQRDADGIGRRGQSIF